MVRPSAGRSTGVASWSISVERQPAVPRPMLSAMMTTPNTVNRRADRVRDAQHDSTLVVRDLRAVVLQRQRLRAIDDAVRTVADCLATLRRLRAAERLE